MERHGDGHGDVEFARARRRVRRHEESGEWLRLIRVYQDAMRDNDRITAALADAALRRMIDGD